MEASKTISGFSKLTKRGKIKWIVENFFKDPEVVMKELMSYWHNSEDQQKILDGFSENTISNYPMPFGVAPNFVINGSPYCIPMVIEESSVVAAASSAAKFWMTRGGFKAEILGTTKVGQLHFKWSGESDDLKGAFEDIKLYLKQGVHDITRNMQKRGGGIMDVELVDFTEQELGYYQLRVAFETCDSMGANFINSVLERFGVLLQSFVLEDERFVEKELQVIMAILSNYTPNCLVRASVECPLEDLDGLNAGITEGDFANKFYTAVKIAHLDPYRAATHNKGIFNGIDAVVLATANDFRAIEACGHAYAAKDGQYRSLSHCEIENGVFRFWIDLPLAVGTVGGLTSLHPIAKRSLELLGNPSAEELMKIIAVTGLAQNFAALKSLITTGIQKGHMKMHLANILIQFNATKKEAKSAQEYFDDKVVSYAAVRSYLKR